MNYVALGYSAVLVLIDQVIKLIVLEFLAPIESVPVIKDIFHLNYQENTGAAYGIFENNTFILVGVTSIVLAIGVVMLVLEKFKDTFLIWTIATVIGGGLGNLVDRIFRGFVIDYLELVVVDFKIFNFFNINFGIFNFADCCVVVGTILIMIYIIFFADKKENKNNLKQSKDVVKNAAN